MTTGEVFFLGVVAGWLLLALAAGLAWFAGPWIRSQASGVPIGLPRILGMKLRGSPVNLLVDAQIALRKLGHNVSWESLETEYIAHRENVRTWNDLLHLVHDRARGVPPDTGGKA